ncbi:MAG TPA: tRNA uridine-5-carboxymethylaminomethyl(34) synthesis GTPase MnmE [Lachnospiraceae bacterium]|nr:tRNA uridine-5-carboxymethylaminomethyl(34) synthesis GTPase MnmE [Lachnospiraceae bacterium]HCG59021.1 tRNA uridine-5-carboxymethylaminomethyl(34) synthesis GTPase MnmE [Lachnospiraceae bacterium]HCI85155.1 tRNA uridine-5-carboxymethylaminomethyl(34) synthesis GTPase MnmE [Lachnospiraceae bacterium]
MWKIEDTDTIAAISTAVSESGIGVIRISGPDAVEIADRVYRSPGGKKRLAEVDTHTIHYGFIVEPEGDGNPLQSGISGASGKSADVIDEVLVSVMRAPRTYTAEDVVEISCHGGVLAVTRVLDAVLKAGARAAQPGEFTKRAYLNGRIDLTEAEAVMDVIESKNRFALQNAVSQVQGTLYRKIEEVRKEMLYQSAHIEACLDDPEALSYEAYLPEFSSEVQQWTKELSALLATADSGRLIQEGIKAAIVGKPNAGKSSLMNLLLGEDRAIVTPVAGTTRDVLTETITVGGMTLVVTDTAGIRETDDLVEKIGVQRAKGAIERADLVLYLIDSSTCIDIEDREILNLIQEKKIIILQNKSDLHTLTDEQQIRRMASEAGLGDDIPVIPFSATEKTGLDELISAIRTLFFDGKLSFNDEIVITNARHKELLKRALESLRQLSKSIESQMPEDFYTIDLMSAYEALGEITGQEAGEDLVNEIFSRFCMGK